MLRFSSEIELLLAPPATPSHIASRDRSSDAVMYGMDGCDRLVRKSIFLDLTSYLQRCRPIGKTTFRSFVNTIEFD